LGAETDQTFTAAALKAPFVARLMGTMKFFDGLPGERHLYAFRISGNVEQLGQ
jgi:hypothetical protein